MGKLKAAKEQKKKTEQKKTIEEAFEEAKRKRELNEKLEREKTMDQREKEEDIKKDLLVANGHHDCSNIKYHIIMKAHFYIDSSKSNPEIKHLMQKLDEI